MSTTTLLTDLKAIQADLEASYKAFDLNDRGYASIRAGVAMQRLVGTLEDSITLLNIPAPQIIAARALINDKLYCFPCYREMCGDPSLTPEDVQDRVVHPTQSTFCEQCHCVLVVPTQPLQGNESIFEINIHLKRLVREYQTMLNSALSPYIDDNTTLQWVRNVIALDIRAKELLKEVE